MLPLLAKLHAKRLAGPPVARRARQLVVLRVKPLAVPSAVQLAKRLNAKRQPALRPIVAQARAARPHVARRNVKLELARQKPDGAHLGVAVVIVLLIASATPFSYRSSKGRIGG